MRIPSHGSVTVKKFYDHLGWTRTATGRFVDKQLFGSHTAGELQDAAYQLRVERIRSELKSTHFDQRIVECGAGGNPATFLSDLFQQQLLVDFSATGLTAARGVLARTPGSDHRAIQADMCQLPIASESCDAAYSANAIYHIPDPSAQRAAFAEILRSVRAGGVAVFILANPRPWLFPGIFLRRLLADTPYLGAWLNRLRRSPPLPYQPKTIGWTIRALQPFGSVRVTTHAMASTWFQQRIPEHGIGRMLWRSLLWIERSHPHLAAYLGNYITVVVHKTASNPHSAKPA